MSGKLLDFLNRNPNFGKECGQQIDAGVKLLYLTRNLILGFKERIEKHEKMWKSVHKQKRKATGSLLTMTDPNNELSEYTKKKI